MTEPAATTSSTPPPATLALSALIGMLLLQCLLFAANIDAWTLVRGEAGDSERQAALSIAIFQGALLAATAYALFSYRREPSQQKITQRTIPSLIAVFLHSAYLWFAIFTIAAAMPNNIPLWIIHEGEITRWNITLVMPGLFLSLYALSKSMFVDRVSVNGKKLTLAALLASCLLCWLLIILGQGGWFDSLFPVAMIIAFSAITLLFLAGVIRVFDYLLQIDVAERYESGHYLLAFTLGLGAPLAGLAINAEISFPADFQSAVVYVLAVVNGFILLLKPTEGPFLRARLLLRGMTVPFTLYFFVVFLPFLPLALPAMLIVGLGALILIPLALGLFQARVTAINYTAVARRYGHTKATAILALGTLLLPGALLGQTLLDKQSLYTAINYFYSHDRAAAPLTDYAQTGSARALVRLKHRKNTSELPYIGSLYSSIVFGNMVLSDSKLRHMHNWLTGQDIPYADSNSYWFSQRSASRPFAGITVPPSRDVQLQGLTVTSTTAGNSTLKTHAENQIHDTHALYVGDIKIPEGVFVSGQRLKIGEDWVDGKFVDRKTALWVFQKITEVRRDPALLTFKTRDSAELRVYPFPATGIREVEIDLSHHPEAHAVVTIDGRNAILNGNRPQNPVLSISGALLDSRAIQAHAFTRTPYLHFILDYSNAAKKAPADYARQMAQVGVLLGH